MEDGLIKLDKMTIEEGLMANAEALRVARNTDKKVVEVDTNVQGVGENVKEVKEKIQMVISGAQT